MAGGKKTSLNTPSKSTWSPSSKSLDKNSSEYLEKRLKNNRAVKRSRDKTKAKAVEATTRVQRLQMENEQLRNTVDSMTSELKYLKEMLICQAGTSEYLSPGTEADIEYILRDDVPTDMEKMMNVLTEIRRIQSLQQQRVPSSSVSNESSFGLSAGSDYSHHLQHPALHSSSSNSVDSHLDYHNLHSIHY